MDPWYLSNLVCPRDRELMSGQNEQLRCSRGHVYPVVDGVPVMLLDNEEQTIGAANKSLGMARGNPTKGFRPPFYLEILTLDIGACLSLSRRSNLQSAQLK